MVRYCGNKLESHSCRIYVLSHQVVKTNVKLNNFNGEGEVNLVWFFSTDVFSTDVLATIRENWTTKAIQAWLGHKYFGLIGLGKKYTKIY